jgi:hypothetical protein
VIHSDYTADACQLQLTRLTLIASLLRFDLSSDICHSISITLSSGIGAALAAVHLVDF